MASLLALATALAAQTVDEEAADMTAHAPNRLAGEASPYLRQHAENPVDWHPWGEEAFEAARERGVPIFLSIGYSTCYWCHVMERESFEDEETAALMNELFVCIKVDREERPDVDDIYITATQIANQGRAGWPLSIWLTPPGAEGADDPGLKPFVCATYLQRDQFRDACRNINHYWTTQREGILDQANRLSTILGEHYKVEANPAPVGPDDVGAAVAFLMERMYDEVNGGFGEAPKFPQPVFLEFLLDAVEHLNDDGYTMRVDEAIRHTLDRMALGGTYDQVGGGFHRYSVDKRWLVPHFEKMLYDNAQLARLYGRAATRYDDRFFERVARDILMYVAREMTDHETGAFYSAQDAEVQQREGLNYLWTPEQFREVLGEEDAKFAAALYGVNQGTNFRDPHHPDEESNVLYMIGRPEAFGEDLGMSGEEVEARERRIDEALYAARQQRPQPALDDKVLTAWNGMMIAALADCARHLDDEVYLDRARRAANYLLTAHRDESGDLIRTGSGSHAVPGYLEDYAMFVDGLLALHLAATASDATELKWLDAAKSLADRAEVLFADPQVPGVYYDTRAGQGDLIVRTRGQHDGAIPAANSMMISNWMTLHEITGDRRYLRRAVDQVGAMSRTIGNREWPISALQSTRGLHRLLQMDESLVEEFASTSERSEQDLPVEIYSDRDRVTVTREAPGEVRIQMRIDEAYHINAHDPGVELMVPLSVDITGGTGVRAVVEYPEGALLEASGVPQEMKDLRVHEGRVELTIRLERTDEAWSGRPLITVTYQACTNEMCLAPMTVELDVAVDGE